MKQFEGFPSRMQFTSVPNLFFSRLMPEIEDITELKVTLHIFRMIYMKKGTPRYVTFSELLEDSGVTDSIRGGEGELADILAEALEKAADRGTIIRLDFERDDITEPLFFVNTEHDRNAVDRIRTGEQKLPGLKLKRTQDAHEKPEPVKDIYTLYEENVGLLNPMIAEGLKEAEKLYPEVWIRDAIKEAVSLNKRNWRYIERILENWSAEGRSDGTHRRDNQTDPSKFRKQKYDHLVKH